MFRQILFPTDGSELSARARAVALGLAGPLGARVIAIHSYAPYQPPMPDMTYVYAEPLAGEYETAMKAQSAKILAQVMAAAMNAGVACDTVSAVAGAPWDAIVKTAAERGCDAIVMASHGRHGLSGLILGSETQKVLLHSPVPVVVCR